MCGVRLRNKGSEKRRSHSPHGRFGLQDAWTLEMSREGTWRAQWQRVWEGVSECPKCAGSPTTKCHGSTKRTIRDRKRCNLPIESSGSRLEGDKNRVLDDTSSPKRVGFDPRPVPV